jgi:DnaJ-class molecular chaperone
MITACRRCGGCGAVQVRARKGGEETYFALEICPDCGGSGQVEKKPQGATP